MGVRWCHSAAIERLLSSLQCTLNLFLRIECTPFLTVQITTFSGNQTEISVVYGVGTFTTGDTVL